MRWLVPLLIGAITGALLVAAEIPALRRRSLADRLLPYLPAGVAARPTGKATGASLRVLLGAGTGSTGLADLGLLGDVRGLERRLRRVGHPLDVAGFRLRQLVGACLSLLVGVAVVVGAGMPGTVGIVVVLCAPALAVLLPEQALRSAVADREDEVRTALPVVAEQLGMLLSAGWSLGAALGRIARRGNGALADDLRKVGDRTRQGLGAVTALREWADESGVDAATRLVDVLALHQETADLGALIAEEARTMRRDVHRDLLTAIEKRGQQVWVPVTVATLVPGLIFLAVPFVDALRLFTGP